MEPNAKEKDATMGAWDTFLTLPHVLSFLLTIVVLAWGRKLVPAKITLKFRTTAIRMFDKTCAIVPLRSRPSNHDPHTTDASLLRNHTTFKSYTTKYATYPSVRTFYRPHPQVDKLPSTPDPIPLLVFVHGLGGSLAQFKAVVTNFVDVAPCLGIDFPGCGRSKFAPRNWSAYSPAALAELLRLVIQEHAAPRQGVVFVGHSLGCSLSVLAALAPERGGGSPEFQRALGLVAVCPLARAPSGRLAMVLKALLWLPNPIFNVWRWWNKRGGTQSPSVTNFVGQEAGAELRELQVAFNAQSRTPVFRRMAWGVLQQAALPGLETWAKLRLPIFLIGGRGDAVTSADNIDKIAHALSGLVEPSSLSVDQSRALNTNAIHAPAISNRKTRGSIADSDLGIDTEQSPYTRLATDSAHATEVPGSQLPPCTRLQVRTCILPFPASHGLLYDPTLARTLSGLIQSFLPQYIDSRLSASWQLQYLTDSHKWDVKNLAKWDAVPAVSAPIHGLFYAMKTLREVDELHNPTSFAQKWGADGGGGGGGDKTAGKNIKAVIDISNSTPVYDPQALEEAGIEYHKFPTVSKVPPTKVETAEFANLIDRLRSPAIVPSAPEQAPISSQGDSTPENEEIEEGRKMIAVHCHYGFNRTGFFIVSYLIERCGLSVRDAVEMFKSRRPPGIRHGHFVNELFARYCLEAKEGLEEGEFSGANGEEG